MTVSEWKKDFIDYLNLLIMPRDDYNGIISYIDEMPTVDAIPIEYIQKTSKEWAEDGYKESAEALDILVSNWVVEREDNE